MIECRKGVTPSAEVDQARITGRQAMGVTLFRVDKGEHVTSVFTVLEEETEDTDIPDVPPPGVDGAGEGPNDDNAPVPEEGSDG